MKQVFSRLLPVRRRIQATRRVIKDHSLPVLSVYNARSLFPKISSLAVDMEERETDICFITEIWEQDENKKHCKKIEELLEIKGIDYISTSRKNRRGGGAAIAISMKNFTLSKLNIHIPAKVECVWGLLKPIIPNHHISSYIVCSFYSPPDMHKNLEVVKNSIGIV